MNGASCCGCSHCKPLPPAAPCSSTATLPSVPALQLLLVCTHTVYSAVTMSGSSCVGSSASSVSCCAGASAGQAGPDEGINTIVQAVQCIYACTCLVNLEVACQLCQSFVHLLMQSSLQPCMHSIIHSINQAVNSLYPCIHTNTVFWYCDWMCCTRPSIKHSGLLRTSQTGNMLALLVNLSNTRPDSNNRPDSNPSNDRPVNLSSLLRREECP